MPDQLPGARSRVPSGPQTITMATDELETLMERASAAGAIRGVQATKLTAAASTGLDQSQTISSMNQQLKNARIIIGLLLGIAGSVGGVAGSCARGYTERKEEILTPIVVAEAKAERAEVKVDKVATELDARLNAADERVTKVETTLKKVTEALDANTAAVLGIAAKLDGAPPKGTKGR